MRRFSLILALLICLLWPTPLKADRPKDTYIISAQRTTQESSRSEQSRKMLRVEATAYTHTGDRTASGVWPYVGGVAVDPKVIPLGSKLYVEGYGPARAVDTGGDIKGSRIDVFFDTEDECKQYGRKAVAVWITK